MRPVFFPEYISKHMKTDQEHLCDIDKIRRRIEQLREGVPLVSIVIPAFNEQDTILRTLASLSYTIAPYPVEIIVVDNNSTDASKDRIEKSGARYILETKKGVENARDTGLKEAQGIYVISGDADTIYSPHWVDDLVAPLIRHENIACVHGKFSFIPEGRHTRLNF